MNNKTKDENRSDVLFGFIITAVATVIGIVGLICHEPWYEEAHPYLVGRDASWYEVIFTIPHYEGHPPLWHLILAPFAKLGAPYHLSMCLVNVTFISAAAAVLPAAYAPTPAFLHDDAPDSERQGQSDEG